jgi:hypothetical protein
VTHFPLFGIRSHITVGAIATGILGRNRYVHSDEPKVYYPFPVPQPCSDSISGLAVLIVHIIRHERGNSVLGANFAKHSQITTLSCSFGDPVDAS